MSLRGINGSCREAVAAPGQSETDMAVGLPLSRLGGIEKMVWQNKESHRQTRASAMGGRGANVLSNVLTDMGQRHCDQFINLKLENLNHTVMAWFSLIDPSNPGQPSSYQPVGSPSCSGNNQICALQADNDGSGHPEITEDLRNEMLTALNTRTSSTNVQLKS